VIPDLVKIIHKVEDRRIRGVGLLILSNLALNEVGRKVLHEAGVIDLCIKLSNPHILLPLHLKGIEKMGVLLWRMCYFDASAREIASKEELLSHTFLVLNTRMLPGVEWCYINLMRFLSTLVVKVKGVDISRYNPIPYLT